MNHVKLHEIVDELQRESLAKGFGLRLVSSGESMQPFIFDKDILTLREVSPMSVRQGDVIVWRDAQSYPARLIVHRVTKICETGRGVFFRTKGDSNPCSDETLINANDVVGRVEVIRKPWFEIRLSSLSWRILSAYSVCISKIKYFGIRLLKKLKGFIEIVRPEPASSILGLGAFLRANAGLSPLEWYRSIVYFKNEIVGQVKTDEKAADIVSTGGFSEEAMILLRRGARVDQLPVPCPHDIVARYDLIIFSRLINAFSPEQYACEISKIAGSVKLNGKLYLSWVNTGIAGLTVLRRKMWHKLQGFGYEGPDVNAIKCGQNILRFNISRQSIVKALANKGMSVVSSIEENGICAVIAKKCCFI